MTQLLWDISTLTIYAFFPAMARILLQYALDNRTTVRWVKGIFLFMGSIAFGVFVGMMCGLSEKLEPMKEVAAGAAGLMAQDAIVYYLARAQYYQKHPRALRAALLSWVPRIFNSQRKTKK